MAQAAVDRFVQWFRASAPYIHAFRGRTFVIAFGGEALSEGRFVGINHDLNLLAALGVRLVVVHGARAQIDTRLKELGHRTRYVQGLRVTDDITLAVAKEASGRLRVEIEALLSMGLAGSPMAGADIRVASGNFVTAKPIGILEGVDLQHTGEVRKIDVAAIRDRLNFGELVLLSPLGYSASGEIFNVALENVAQAAAVAGGFRTPSWISCWRTWSRGVRSRMRWLLRVCTPRGPRLSSTRKAGPRRRSPRGAARASA